MIAADQAVATSPLSTAKRLERPITERAGKDTVTLTSATWLSVYRVNVRMVEHYRQGRIFLAGDAAHVHGLGQPGHGRRLGPGRAGG